MEVIFVWIVVTCISAAVGASKGKGFQGFLWGFFLGLIGLAIVIFLVKSDRLCKFCQSSLPAGATVCPRCTREQ
jgi:hypothetical protein